jgi:lipoic acid synthetase
MDTEERNIEHQVPTRKVLPRWMKAQMPVGEKYSKVKNLMLAHNLHTICTSGNCPNKGECWSAGTASFMILGDICTRNCRFCNVSNGIPKKVDMNEPVNLANTIKLLAIKHCVITSVDRDDLPDGGAEFWATTIRTVKLENPFTTLEALIPDFNGRPDHIQLVIDAKPEVISHNLETVKRLTPKVRSKARYNTSLMVLDYIAKNGQGIVSKSGIMLGLGETEQEILETMDDLRAVDCKVMTIGQYLQPSPHHIAVNEYVTPERFEFYRLEGLKRGFTHIESSPLVRSSYHAEKHAVI